MPNKENERIKSASRPLSGGGIRRVQVLACDECSFVGEVGQGGARIALPGEVVVKKLQQRGWRITSSAAACPVCVAKRRAPAPKPEPEVIPMTDRQPTISDKRRIRDALDTHYDEDKARYRQSFSDKSVAAKLDLPAKWVADLREANGYGPDVNEAAALRANEFAAIEKEMQELQADLLARFDKLEKRVIALASAASTVAA